MALYVLACLSVFGLTYLINMTMISIFYHRGLAHDAVTLPPWLRRFVATMGIWFTGLDPKAWVCMHRQHHKHSDGPRDPHSPVTSGIFGVLFAQLRSYKKTLVGLARKNPRYTIFVKDLDFDVNVLNRKGLWILPYFVHLGLALAIAIPTGLWALGACYFLGMMSHPLQGWIVNSFGHAIGGRNFDTPDNSRNNHLAAWLIVGEGFQNNHHRYPTSAKFSYTPLELDLGYGLCWTLERFGLLKIRRETLIPAFGEAPEHLPTRSVGKESARFRRESERAEAQAEEASETLSAPTP
ncbi:MAG: acyl-CoA desaturase [Planctomycetes bacterium]|nr:acyl-CoA desaturase [Planctomycetota bacterium]